LIYNESIDRRDILDYNPDNVLLVNGDNTIRKSNVFLLARMSYGLSLNQMQLFAFAIYSTQQVNVTHFQKVDFESKFNLSYKTKHAKEDVKKLFELGFSNENLELDFFEYQRVFQKISYEKGLFKFQWAEDMLPYILKLKNKFMIVDLTITSNFRSSFSWILYDYIKSQFGRYYQEFKKNDLLKLFEVQDKVTYLKNTARFKETVLDVAIGEINEFTEYHVTYTSIKRGRSIVGFELNWYKSKTIENAATEKQLKVISKIIEKVEYDKSIYVHQIDLEGQGGKRVLDTIQGIVDYKQSIDNNLTSLRANEIIKNLKLESLSLKAQVKSLVEQKSLAIKPPLYNWLEERE